MEKNKVSILRKQKGWTQEHLADVCDINIRTIQRLEAGSDTSLETLRLVAEALNVPVAELFESIDDVNGKEDIMNFNAEQVNQLRQRKTEKHVAYDLTRLLFVLVMFVAFYFISTLSDNTFLFVVACSLWVIAWPVGFSLFSVWRNFVLEPNWDKKYPLTIGIKKATRTNEK